MKNTKQLLASTPGGATISRLPDGRWEIAYRGDTQTVGNSETAWEMFGGWAEWEALHTRPKEPEP